MKKSFISLAIITIALASAIGANAAKEAKAKDPTIMVVNKKAIPLSEFEYLYNKNNQQQLNPQTVEEYANMFVDYKLKVAEAEATGVDTTAAFLNEFKKYRDELALPYLKDASVEEALVKQTYDRMATTRDVDYIMMFGGRSEDARAKAKFSIDSVRAAIVDGTGDFAALADHYSVDKNGGHMGWMPVNRFPFDFEDAVYTTPVGQVSEVKELPGFGYFIVRVNQEKPAEGEVHTRHILKLTQGKTPEQVEAQIAKIDSIYALLQAGADFEALARAESEDPGSAANGGDLGWYGKGKMVPEFETVSYELANGEISKPFKTSYGYHIIQKLDSRKLPPLAEVEPRIKQIMSRDRRAYLPIKARIEQYGKEYNATTNANAVAALKKQAAEATDVAAFIKALESDNSVVATVGDKKVTAADVAQALALNEQMTAAEKELAVDNAAKQALENATREYAIEMLPATHEDYRNLINEYRDGMLLFEVSNQNVWDKATKDTQGLENYFLANRAKYATWDKPRYKGYVVFSQSDSIQNEVKGFINANPSLKGEEMVKALRGKFKKNIKIERVLAADGENPIINHIAFNGPAPERPSKQWPAYFGFEGKVIDQPEEAADVKGLVTADYQQELEKEWLKQLHKKYPVKVNTKVLKQVKTAE